METIKAKVEKDVEKCCIRIELEDGAILIPLSSDQPNEVKAAFNKLIKRLKDGSFQIELEDLSDDLFSQVSEVYISQLNRELNEVFGEMVANGLAVSN